LYFFAFFNQGAYISIHIHHTQLITVHDGIYNNGHLIKWHRRHVLDIALLFDLALDGGGWSRSRPGHFIPRKEPMMTVGWASEPLWAFWIGESLGMSIIEPARKPVAVLTLYTYTVYILILLVERLDDIVSDLVVESREG